MEELLQHFSHEHPLIFIDSDERNVGGVEICDVCTQKISGFAYSCNSCCFFLHKICAELPEEMSDPLHPEHPLTLLPQSPYLIFELECAACGEISEGFTYHCSPCKFYLDPRCSLRSRSIEHKSHQHPLIFTDRDEQNVDDVETICNGCTQKISGFAYSCKSCSFFLHKICAELPEKMSHPLHPEHPLTLLPRSPYYGSSESQCNACGKFSKGFTCHCSLCEFDLDLCCALKSRSIEHKSHQHPLIFTNRNEQNVDGVKTICYGCTREISGFAYSCKSCSFFLHKICAELPEEVNHPLHPEHSLTILPHSPYWEPETECDACEKPSIGFTYHCSLCDFNLDLCCALRSRSIEHKSHKHPLSLVYSRASFECYACCCTTYACFSYMCNGCSFWIHDYCALLPLTIKNNSHIHLLELAYSLPSFYSSVKCHICEEDVNRHCWIYHCEGCEFVIHVQCSMITKESKISIPIEALDVTSSIHLPLLDELTSLIDQFVEQISLEDDKRSKAEINHFSHNHPLILSDIHSDNNLCSASGGELSLINEKKKVCDACVRPISTSKFYSCGACNFFLHKRCAYLPSELKHPGHPHPMILQEKRPEEGLIFFSYGCCEFCSGFVYKCVECRYRLDVRSASLPSSIMHEVHEHPLFLKHDCITEGCAACSRSGVVLSFGCGTCNFSLHYKCALLPRTIKHRYDKHPFTLFYAAIKNGPDEYYCEFCEEEIHPNRGWFYHCIDCNQSACAYCIYHRDAFPRIKWGTTHKFDSHPHLLTLVEFRSTNKSPYKFDSHPHLFTLVEFQPMNKSCTCDECDIEIDEGAHFKCMQCNIMLHEDCAS